jgi:hypothetical protein
MVEFTKLQEIRILGIALEKLASDNNPANGDIEDLVRNRMEELCSA